MSKRGFFQKHLEILRSRIPIKSATEKLIINVITGETRLNSVVEPRSGCLLVCIRTSDINKCLTIALPTSCPNTRDSITAQNRVFVHAGSAWWAQGVTGVYRSSWLHISSHADVNGTCEGLEKETRYVMVLIRWAESPMKAQMTCSCESVLGAP